MTCKYTLNRTNVNWTLSEEKNFLILLSKHIRDHRLDLIPNGIILKQPEPIYEEGSAVNTEIDVIGVPFRRTYNRVKLKYRRILLSEFYNRYRDILGTRNSPIKVEDSDDDSIYEQNVLNAISTRLGVPSLHFKVSRIGINNGLNILEFKFNIPVTEFTTEDSGLVFYNDKPIYIYANNNNIRIEHGRGLLDFTSFLDNIQAQPGSAYLPNNTSNILSEIDGEIPDEYHIEHIISKMTYSDLYEGIVKGYDNSVMSSIYKIPNFLSDNINVRIHDPDGIEYDRFYISNSNNSNNLNIINGVKSGTYKIYYSSKYLPYIYLKEVELRGMDRNSEDISNLLYSYSILKGNRTSSSLQISSIEDNMVYVNSNYSDSVLSIRNNISSASSYDFNYIINDIEVNNIDNASTISTKYKVSSSVFVESL